jgi:aspartyl protease family protein
LGGTVARRVAHLGRFMLKIAAIALVAAASAAGASKAMISIAEAQAVAREPVATSVEVVPTSISGDATSVVKGPDGHYWAQAQAGDHSVRFLVDTGASAVTLSAADKLDFDHIIITANGEARAALITLPSLSVAGVRVLQVKALVAESGLDTSLLGMTFLGRLSRFEATPTSLILRP